MTTLLFGQTGGKAPAGELGRIAPAVPIESRLPEGVRKVVAPRDAHRDPLALARVIGDRAVTVAQFVPSVLEATIDQGVITEALKLAFADPAQDFTFAYISDAHIQHVSGTKFVRNWDRGLIRAVAETSMLTPKPDFVVFGGDLAQLGETFNKMTQELRTQRDDIVRARDLIDSRRRFTEAVLAVAVAYLLTRKSIAAWPDGAPTPLFLERLGVKGP